MGNCVGKKKHHPSHAQHHRRSTGPHETVSTSRRFSHSSRADLPKAVSLPKNTVLICLDAAATPESSRLKTALKGSFGGLTSFNNEHVLLDNIKSIQGHNFYIVITGKVHEKTIKSLVDNAKVKAIYLCLGRPITSQIPESSKIKGFFEKRVDLHKAIYDDVHNL